MEATSLILEVQELAKWAPSVTELKRQINSMEALEKSSMSDGAKREQDAILEKIPVWKPYYPLEDLSTDIV
jgi:hypothetical protein